MSWEVSSVWMIPGALSTTAGSLRFRDVVRYLVFEEYTHSGSNNRWTSTDGGDVVTRVIPEEI